MLAVLSCFLIVYSACTQNTNELSSPAADSFFAMNTYISMTVYGDNTETDIDAAKVRLTELEKLWSVTDKDSEIYAVNHSGGKTVTVGNDTANLIAYALKMAEKTGGALEPTLYPVLTAWGFTTDENRVPADSEIKELLKIVGYDRVRQNGNELQLPDGMMLDLGAVGKGYAGDEITELLKKNGVKSALLDLGGNIQMIGKKPDGSDWRIALRDPTGTGNVGILTLSDCAVVTSGNYERYFIADDGTVYGHIIDPSTGYPVKNDLLSVTVISEEGKLCDALSTSLFVMGLNNATDYWRKNGGFDMLLITENGEIYITEGIKDSFTLDSTHSNMKIRVIKP